MRPNCGVLYLALGSEFDKLTAATARHSRANTSLPFYVLTNLDEISAEWKEVSNVRFKYIPIPSEKNRTLKVSLIDYTPFDRTLFMDSDAVIQRPGIENMFKLLDDKDIVCQYYGYISEDAEKIDFLNKTYAFLAGLLNENYPIHLFSEAGFLFNRNKSGKEFFERWRKYWRMMGCGRDMPGFSFAVKHYFSRVETLKCNKSRLCTNVEDETFLIQHKGFKGFTKKFNLPEYEDWNPEV